MEEPDLFGIDTEDSNFKEVVKILWKKARSGDISTIKYMVQLGVMKDNE